MVERDGNTDPVAPAVSHAQTGQIRIVQDAVVRERRPLGRSRGPAGVLDVDGVAGGERGAALRQLLHGHLGAGLDQCAPRVGIEEDRLLEVGQLRSNLAEHRAIVRALEAGRGDQHPAAGLAQGVLELGDAIGGVDVDQDDAELRGRVLGQDPLRAVGAPDPHPVADAQPLGEQPAGECVHRNLELGVAVAKALGGKDQGLLIRSRRDGARQIGSDGLLQQGDVRTAANLRCPHLSFR